MYERFTDRARKVMQLANQECQRCNCEWILPGHILVGLLKEGSSVAGTVLKNLGFDLGKLRDEIAKSLPVGSGEDSVLMGRMPHSPEVKKIVQYAVDAAIELNHSYVGTEHVLLGTIRQQDERSPGESLLAPFGVTAEKVREEVGLLLKGSTVDELIRVTAERDSLMAKLTAIQQIIFGIQPKTEMTWHVSIPVEITETK